VIDGLKPYTDRKDSGLPWLGEIPAHWDVRRNGRLFVQRNQTGFPDLPILEVSLKTGVRVRDFENSNRKQVMADREKYKRARQGDIAYNMMRMWQGAVGTSPVDGLVSPAYVVAKPLPDTESRYYQYLFRTGAYMDEVNKFSRGIVSDRNRLYWEDFKQMPSPFPPPEEQAAIVRFLDHADRRIRRYIRAERQLIALLNEQKQAIIHRAVTRGLDPHVKLKPSGVEWLGDVPEHWGVRRLRSLARVKTGERDTKDRVAGGEFPFFVRSQVVERINSWSFDGEAVLTAGDGNGGVAKVFHYVNGKFDYHQRVYKFSHFQKVLGRFFFEYFRATLKFEALSGNAKATVNLSLRQPMLMSFPCVVPPIEEQAEIVKYLEQSTANIDSAIHHAEQEIQLLREYHTRLIADVVTGKLDVREAAAALPDELEAVEPDAEELLDEDYTTDDAELDTEPEEAEA